MLQRQVEVRTELPALSHVGEKGVGDVLRLQVHHAQPAQARVGGQGFRQPQQVHPPALPAGGVLAHEHQFPGSSF